MGHRVRVREAVCLLMLIAASRAGLGQGAKGAGGMVSVSVRGRDRVVYTESHAVVVGINGYPYGSAFRPLSFSVDDAESVRDLLVGVYGFPQANVTLLTDKTEPKPTRAAILSALTRLSRVRNKDARVVFYFSGHGQTVKVWSGKAGYLVPASAALSREEAAEPGELEAKCISMQAVRRKLGVCKARHRLVLLDACFSGLAISGKAGLPPTVPDYLAKVAFSPVLKVFVAGQAGEEVFEKPEWGHGAFTKRLLDVLRPNDAGVVIADQNGDGYITTDELWSLVPTRVREMTGGKQNPMDAQEGDGEMLFAPTIHVDVGPDIAPRVGEVSLSCDIAGGTVFLDGRQVGVMRDGSLRIASVPVGSHKVLVKLPEHKDWSSEFTVKDGMTLYLMAKPEKIRTTAQLTVRSEPSGAEVFFGAMDKPYGRTPRTFPARRGTYQVILRFADGRIWRKRVTITGPGDDQVIVGVAPRPAPEKPAVVAPPEPTLVISGVSYLGNESTGISGQPVSGKPSTYCVAAEAGDVVRAIISQMNQVIFVVSGDELVGTEFTADGFRCYLSGRIIALDLDTPDAVQWLAHAHKADLASVSYVKADALRADGQRALLRLAGQPIILETGDCRSVAPVLSRLQLIGLKVTDRWIGDRGLADIAKQRRLKWLSMYHCDEITDLTPLTSLTGLTSLSLESCTNVRDLSPIAKLTGLTSLSLDFCHSLGDLSPIANLTELTSLSLWSCGNVSDLNPISRLTRLKGLRLNACKNVRDLTALARLRHIESLWLPPSTTNEQLATVCADHPGLTSLDLDGCHNMSDLTPLAYLTCLTSLNLSSCDNVTYLTPLAGLTQLNSLYLRGCTSVSDLAPLTPLTRLKRLHLTGCKNVGDLTPLARLRNIESLWPPPSTTNEQLTTLCSGHPGLTSLELRGCEKISDLTPLAGLTRLRSLGLSGCQQVADLSPLARLTALEHFNLSHCGSVTNLTPLAGLTRLTFLNIDHCENVRYLPQLTGLTRLGLLRLYQCQKVSDLPPLARLRSLWLLDLSFCDNIRDLTPLAGLTGLRHLNLFGAENVRDLAPLATLTSLSSLHLSSKSVTHLAPLARLTSLTSLYLSGCTNVSDLSPLVGLTSLTSLNLSSCDSVSDLTPLAGLTRLQSLGLSSCHQVSDLSPLANLTGLTSLSLSVNAGVSDLSALARLRDLRSLCLPSSTTNQQLAALCPDHPGLTSLYLIHCRNVSDLTPLHRLTGLRALHIPGCTKLTKEQVDGFKKAVPECEVSGP